MKKNYLLPRQNVVEIEESNVLCASDQERARTKVQMNDYDTYTEPDDKSGNSVNWTGSDF